MIKNTKLYEALKEYTVKLFEKGVPFKIASFQERKWILSPVDPDSFQRDNYIRRILVNSPASKESIDPEIYTIMEKCKEIILGDDILRSQVDNVVGIVFQRQRIEIDALINHVFITMFNRIEKSFFDKDIFDEVYQILEDAMYSDSIIVDILAPIYGIGYLPKTIKFNDDIEIVKMSDEDIIKLLENGFQLGRVDFNPDHCFMPSRHAIKLKYKYDKIIGDVDDRQKPFDHQGDINMILQCLRLIKNDNIGIHGSIRRVCHPLLTGYSFNKMPVTISIGNARFAEEEIIKLRNIWNIINSLEVSEYKFIEVAVKRFSQARERKDLEDEIIDLMVCAESIFLNDGDNSGELSFRLSLRAAYFLGENADERKRIYDFMKKAYRIRSKIVHGSNKSSGSDNLPEIASQLEDYLRKAIIKTLKVDGDKKIDWMKVVFMD